MSTYFYMITLLYTELQVTLYLGLGGLIVAIGTPLVKGLWQQWKEHRSKKASNVERTVQEQSTVEIAKIQDEAATRNELWTEVRFLRKDYNGLSLAYAELQKQNAEQRGEVKYMKLQMENVLTEVSALRTQVKTTETLLTETQHTLKIKEVELEHAIHDLGEARLQVATLENDVLNKQALIESHEKTIEGLRLEIAALKGENHD